MLLLCAAFSSFEDFAGPGPRFRGDLIIVWSPVPLCGGKYGAPTWAKPIPVPDQQVIYPLGIFQNDISFTIRRLNYEAYAFTLMGLSIV